ncbi:MAG TPA: GtrA family protein [Solirubrobacteraceae bacterium]|nr:GtrA family protein [Solirubrobacteraceae bacterium]
MRDLSQQYLDACAAFIRRHPWWLRLTRTPFSAKMTKYALGSVVAFVMGIVFFDIPYWMGFVPTVCTVVSFIAAAIPNWILNRRWAWQQTGRPPAKQTITYVMVSAVVLVVTSAATTATNNFVKAEHVPQHTGLRLIIVTGSFVLVNVVLFFAKFAIYEFWVFSDRSRVRTALRSLMNVSRMTRPNRIP